MKEIKFNKKIKHDYTKITSYEVGIVLNGNEVKSIRNGNVELKGSFCKFIKNELFVFNMNISKYENSNTFSTINENKDRKLLLKRKELNKLENLLVKGLTIIPFRIYFDDNNRCKLEIWLAKGNTNYDKRHLLKDRDLKKDSNKEY